MHSQIAQLDVIRRLTAFGDVTLWEETPHRVTRLYKQAAPVAQAVRAVVRRMPQSGGSVTVFWHPEVQAAAVSFPDGTDESTRNRWQTALRAISGVRDVQDGLEWVPSEPGWVKVAAPFSYLGNAWAGANKLLGGPSALSSSIVGSLLTGALGYGAGTVAEHLFPERYVERGKLRKTLGLAGLGLGALPGVWKATVHRRNSADAGQPLSWGQSFTTQDQNVPTKEAMALLDFVEVDPRLTKSASWASEQLYGHTGAMNLDTVPVDAFNRAVWNDVRRGVPASQNPFGTKNPWGNNEQSLHTPPAMGAATAGLMSGIQAMHGGPELLSPKDVIRGIASAGVGLATATLAGKTLSALAGLSPYAQEKLQDAGIWYGVLSSVVPTIFGRR